MERFFKLRENNTTVKTEIIAGVTTFFTMAYILVVNPGMLSQTGLSWGAVFLATAITSALGTLFMGLFANVPYALAPGMGLNAFFTYSIVFGKGFTPYEALGMVFICGIINILITVTKVRKLIVKSIPLSLQHAIGGGIGIFIAYIGLLNVSAISFSGTLVDGVITSPVPALADISNPAVILFYVGLILTLVLMVKKVKYSILIGIIAITVLAIPAGVIDIGSINWGANSLTSSFADFGDLFGKAVTEGIPGLFKDPKEYLFVFSAIFAFSLSDTFDTIGTFIGTGRRTGIFSDDDEKALEHSSGFSSKMDKALFADSIATSVGAILGTSNVTTYVESSAGIEAGGRTGLTSVIVALLFLLSIFILPIISIIPSAATSPALVVVGILMIASFADIDWTDLETSIPAFFAGTITAIAYNISDGLAFGFIFYTIIKITTGKSKDLNPIIIGATVLFILKYVITALQSLGII